MIMVILAVDTSGRHGSIALCRGDATSFEVLGLSLLEGGTYSARLIPAIGDLMSGAELTKSQIDGLVVVDGPGSFTGLRVGLSTVKALCEILQKPLAVVSMLEALVITYGNDGESVTAVVDAGRGEVYVGEFSVSGKSASLVQQSIQKLDEFLQQARSAELRILTTLPTLAEALAATSSKVATVDAVHADAIARIGLRKLLAGKVADPATLDANYIRRSDAELFSLPRH
jgi:tRNA threonylcarbamoyladenosine biosynthesis protein TsaB